MANEATYGTISSVINSIYETAFLTARELNVVQPLVVNFVDTNSSTPRKWTEYSGGTVQTITEATDMAAQGFLHAVAGTLTPAQFGAAYFLTDQRVNSDWRNASQDAGRDLGGMLAEKVDLDLVGNFASLAGGTVGAANGTLTWADVMLAMAKLRANKAPAPYSCVLRPEHWYHLTSATTVPDLIQSDNLKNAITGQYYVGSFGPVNFWIDANITAGTASVGAMFAREAIAFDLRRALRIEPQRDASRGGGGWELNATMIYAEGIYRPLYGVQIIGTTS
jgi:hypothetical protein